MKTQDNKVFKLPDGKFLGFDKEITGYTDEEVLVKYNGKFVMTDGQLLKIKKPIFYTPPPPPPAPEIGYGVLYPPHYWEPVNGTAKPPGIADDYCPPNDPVARETAIQYMYDNGVPEVFEL